MVIDRNDEFWKDFKYDTTHDSKFKYLYKKMQEGITWLVGMTIMNIDALTVFESERSWGEYNGWNRVGNGEPITEEQDLKHYGKLYDEVRCDAQQIFGKNSSKYQVSEYYTNTVINTMKLDLEKSLGGKKALVVFEIYKGSPVLNPPDWEKIWDYYSKYIAQVVEDIL